MHHSLEGDEIRLGTFSIDDDPIRVDDFAA
jgi:hypothetical protein